MFFFLKKYSIILLNFFAKIPRMEWRSHLAKAEALFNECRHAIGLVKVVRYK
jgi:hypothetical protein